MSNTITRTLSGPAARAHELSCPSETGAHDVSKLHATKPDAEEIEFYGQYSWALNACPTLREVLEHLSTQLISLESMKGWQQREVLTNIFLLACSVTDTLDDYIAGSTYDFSKLKQAFPPAGLAVSTLNGVMAGARRLREAQMSRLRTWNEAWRSAVTDFLQHTMVDEPTTNSVVQQRARLMRLLPPRLPRNLWNARPKMPAFFRSRDFTPLDCLELGRKFSERFPAGERPLFVLGLRTAGSFLAPLLCASLRTRVPAVDWIAVRPKKGLASSEKAALREAARRRARVLVIDESIHSGQTLVTTIALLRKTGFPDDDVVVLNPVEPAFPHWRDSSVLQSVPRIHVITLEPAERYKQRLMDSGAVSSLLHRYYRANGYADTSVVASPETESVNAEWCNLPPERVDVRLKRVFEVHLTDAGGRHEIRRVVAKSVGWGWLGYHAFLAAQALKEFVPPVLGLRDGILYSEWLPNQQGGPNRQMLIETLGSYVASRANMLRLAGNPTPDLAREERNKGLEMSATALSRAYGSRVAAAVQRFRIQEEISRTCSLAVATDSKMAVGEWILNGSRLYKTDFEHHGQGKNELGTTDPAYDLADAIFQFGLSKEEERQLLDCYIRECGDMEIEDRLFTNKVLAGLWAQNLATLGLQNKRLAGRRDEFNQQSISSWNFLVSQTVRECGKLCRGAEEPSWTSPLVVLDVDGVLDRMVFGFPSATAAGIKALSLFAYHGFTVALNTARTLREVKEYCDAYGLAGGVAEYGAVAWDRATNYQVALVGDDSMHELEKARRALGRIPGVFLNEDYQYSLRAFTYQNGRTAPLPRLMVQHVLAELKLERLQVHYTGLDTAITAQETDKGKGLRALLSLVGLADAEVSTVGDSEPDLAMFRVAGHSFAPGNVSCRKEAELLGCRIAKAGYQLGLLEIARNIVHPDGRACQKCRDVESTWRRNKGLFVSLLNAADKKPLSLFLRHCLDPSIWRLFRT